MLWGESPQMGNLRLYNFGNRFSSWLCEFLIRNFFIIQTTLFRQFNFGPYSRALHHLASHKAIRRHTGRQNYNHHGFLAARTHIEMRKARPKEVLVLWCRGYSDNFYNEKLNEAIKRARVGGLPLPLHSRWMERRIPTNFPGRKASSLRESSMTFLGSQKIPLSTGDVRILNYPLTLLIVKNFSPRFGAVPSPACDRCGVSTQLCFYVPNNKQIFYLPITLPTDAEPSWERTSSHWQHILTAGIISLPRPRGTKQKYTYPHKIMFRRNFKCKAKS